MRFKPYRPGQDVQRSSAAERARARVSKIQNIEQLRQCRTRCAIGTERKKRGDIGRLFVTADGTQQDKSIACMAKKENLSQ